LKESILSKGDFGDLTLPKLLKVNEWVIILPLAILITFLLIWFELAGL
jgi:hypothetical protein